MIFKKWCILDNKELDSKFFTKVATHYELGLKNKYIAKQTTLTLESHYLKSHKFQSNLTLTEYISVDYHKILSAIWYQNTKDKLKQNKTVIPT